jgi:dihydroorotase
VAPFRAEHGEVSFELLLKGGICVNHNGVGAADVGLSGGRIAAIGDLAKESAAQVLDVRGLHVLPGVIDTQVHFREPGMEHKEDFETGSRAAILGGVTAVFDMPNTKPPTTSADALADKLKRAQSHMHCHYAFYVGAAPDNIDALSALEGLAGVCGVKLFMGSSTGSLLVAADTDIARALASGRRRLAVHAEDEARLSERRALAESGAPATHVLWRDVETARRATERLLRLAQAASRRVHVLHVSTADEIPLLAAHRDFATVEVTPQHLTLAAPEAYARLGTLAQMNPPIREERHREALWRAVREGVVDVLGTDHAPHTREEKSAPYPGTPSGMPGVQTLVPVMLDHVNAGRLSLERFVDLTAHGPKRVFGIAGKGRLAVGYDADLTIVDLKARRMIEESWIASKCGWTPFAGMRVRGWPKGTIIKGIVAMWEDTVTAPASGAPIRFEETLARSAAGANSR